MLFPSYFGTSSLQPFHMCYALLFSWWLHHLFNFLKGLKLQMWSKENFHAFRHQRLHVCLPSTVLQSLREVALAPENNPLLRQWDLCLQLLKVIAPTVTYRLLTHVFRFFSMDGYPKWLSVLWLFFLSRTENSSTPFCLQKPPHLSIPYWNILWKGCLHSVYVFLLAYTDLLN